MNKNKTILIDDFFIIDDLDEVNCIEIEPEWVEYGYKHKYFKYECEY